MWLADRFIVISDYGTILFKHSSTYNYQDLDSRSQICRNCFPKLFTNACYIITSIYMILSKYLLGTGGYCWDLCIHHLVQILTRNDGWNNIYPNICQLTYVIYAIANPKACNSLACSLTFMYRKMYNFEIVQVSNINIMTPTAKRNTTHKLRSMDYDFRLASPAPAASSKVGAPTPSSGPLSPWCPRQLCSRQPGSPGQGFNWYLLSYYNMKDKL